MRVLLFVTAISAFAQVQQIEMTFEGVNCVPCVDSMATRTMRIRGVESASVDAAKGVLTVRLAKQNRVRVEQIRDLIQQDGTKAVRATVEVTGTVAKNEAGAWILQIPQQAVPMELSIAEEPGATVTVRGVIEDLKRDRLLLRVGVSKF
jgi:cation transport ATPase